MDAQAQSPLEPRLAELVSSGAAIGPLADEWGNQFMQRTYDDLRFWLLVHTAELLCEACLTRVARKNVGAHECNEWWKQ